MYIANQVNKKVICCRLVHQAEKVDSCNLDTAVSFSRDVAASLIAVGG